MSAKRLLYSFALVFLLASCAQRDKLSLSMWGQSVTYFNFRHVDAAQTVARRLWWIDRDGSYYLLGQYAIYKVIADGNDPSKNMANYYRDILNTSMDIKNPAFYPNLIAARAFSERYLHGADSARRLYSTECKKYLKLDPSPCVLGILKLQENRYRETHDPFDALSAYEAAVLAQDLDWPNPHITDWLVAYPMITINNTQASKIVKVMASQGALTHTMKKAYCEFFEYEKNAKPALDCTQP